MSNFGIFSGFVLEFYVVLWIHCSIKNRQFRIFSFCLLIVFGTVWSSRRSETTEETKVAR